MRLSPPAYPAWGIAALRYRARGVKPGAASDSPVRVAAPADAADAGRLLHDFNTEFGDTTPGPVVLARRVERLISEGQTVVLLVGDGPDGVAVLRFRTSIWTPGLECYLAELYVAARCAAAASVAR
jgi:hypothetical protein